MPESYSVPMRSTAPFGSPTQYTDPKQIDSLLKSSDPDAVISEGQSYQKFAAAYEKIAAELIAMSSDLHEAWDGKDAAAAQSQLREVWAAATTVHKTATTFGVTIERHGSDSLAWYKNNKPPSKNLAEAQSWMTGANERISQSWSSLPPDLSTTLPPGYRRDEHGPARSPGASAPVGTGTPAVGSSGIGSSGPSSRPLSSDYSKSPGYNGNGTQLSSLSPSWSPSSNPFDVGLGAEAPPGVFGGPSAGAAPMPPGTGITPASALVPPGGIGDGFPGAGSRGPSLSTPGEAVAENSQAAEGGLGARAGITGPMTGGARGEERERTRQTWLVEDEDLWTGDVEPAPQVIGGDEPTKNWRPEPTEESIEIDLSADNDDIADVLVTLSGEEDSEVRVDDAEDISTQIAELREQLAWLERRRDTELGIVTMNEENNDLGLKWIVGEDD